MRSNATLTRREALATGAVLAPMVAAAQGAPPSNGGSGWTVLAWNQHTRELHNYWASDHSQSAVMGTPLLVLDLYEHAYHIDFGASAARYVDAFFANVHWDEVQRRLERARRP